MLTKLGEKTNINYDSTQFKWGITAFLVLAAAIVFFFSIFKIPSILSGLDKLIKILMPFVYGLVLAYLLCPVYNLFMKYLLKFLVKSKSEKRTMMICRLLSTTFTMLIAFAVMGALFSLVLPQLITSINSLVKAAPENIERFIDFVSDKLSANKDLNSALNILLGDYTDKINKWLETDVLPWLLKLAANMSAQAIGVLVALKDFCIGIIICIYFLNSKDIFKGQSKKVIFAFLQKRKATRLIKEMTFINKTFSSFINGKIIDTFVVGIICFAGMSIMKMPYAMLISVIIAVTNIIPFFGPFIGGIPATIIILTVNPMQALYFIIFTTVLQQIEGNIIAPKILGDSTGLTSFWVMFAIIVGGGLFGFLGMIIGIPIFAIIYIYSTRYIDHKLRRKGLPTDTDVYKDVAFFMPKRHRIVKK